MRRIREFVEIMGVMVKAALVGTLSAVLLAFTGCSGGPDMGRMFSVVGEDERASSLYGNYLAGRFAGATRDMSAAARFYAEALDHDPDNTVILERAFLLELAAGQIDDAVELAGRILETDERNRLARLTLALDAFKSGNFEKARADLDVSRDGPINTLIRNLVVAWTYAAEGDVNAAVAFLDQVSANTNLPALYAINRAFLNDFGGRDQDAVADYVEALRLTEGRSIDVVLGYGSLLERLGRSNEAGRLYADYLVATGDVVAIGPELERLDTDKLPERYIDTPARGIANAIYDPATYLVRERAIDLPIIYLQLSRYVDKGFAESSILLADLMELSEQWEAAIDIYDDVPEDSIYYESAQIQIAVNLDRLDRTGDAVARLKDIIADDPDNFDAYITLGDMLRIRDRFEESIDVYDEALSLVETPAEQHWSLFYALGVAHERAGNWAEAEKNFKRSLDLSPDQPLTLNYLGYSWIDQDIRPQEALALVTKAAELRPEDGFIIDSVGWGHYKLGNFAEAVKYLERAVELQPTDPTINDHLGDAYWRVGRQLEARFQWRLALAMDPEEDDIPEIQRKLTEGLDPISVREASNR